MGFGLLVFMAGLGLHAGGDSMETFVAAGPVLVLTGICVTAIPVLVGYFFGRKYFEHPSGAAVRRPGCRPADLP